MQEDRVCQEGHTFPSGGDVAPIVLYHYGLNCAHASEGTLLKAEQVCTISLSSLSVDADGWVARVLLHFFLVVCNFCQIILFLNFGTTPRYVDTLETVNHRVEARNPFCFNFSSESWVRRFDQYRGVKP